MLTTIRHNFKKDKVNLLKPIDISLPIAASKKNVKAWYLDSLTIEPVSNGDWVGSVKKGYSVNFNNIHFNPHAHGTHSECVGHITKEFYSINDCLKTFFFIVELISVTSEKQKHGDEIITLKCMKKALKVKGIEALIIRTLLNKEEKKTKQYSNTNPPYLSEEAAICIRELGVKQLLNLQAASFENDASPSKPIFYKI